MEKDDRADYWQSHVLSWRESGQAQSAYCRAHGLAKSRLSYWHHRFLRTGLAQGSAPQSAPLTLVRAVAPDRSPPVSILSLYSPTGWRIDFTTLPAPSWLVEVLGAQT